jgi:hypothetical protein
MITIRRSKEKIAYLVKWHKKRNIPYTLEIQNETVVFKTKEMTCSSLSYSYSIEEINFIKAVKRYIAKNESIEKYRDKYTMPGINSKVKYFYYSPSLKPGKIIDDVVNIDLSSAYWETANKFGLLSKELYSQGLKVRKQVRLATIGSLAKKKRIYQFNGKKVSLLDKRRSEQTEFLWPAICDHVGKLLMKTAKECGKDFIFFWVDGIYVRKAAVKKVCKMFKQAGYDYKINPLKAVSVTQKNLYVHLLESEQIEKDGEKTSKDVKSFPFRPKQKAEAFKGYNSDL